MDPEIQEVAELLFSRRLEAFRHAIDADTNAAAGDDSSAIARGARVAACGDLFRGHCSRVLRDYVALLAIFDALAVPDGLGSTFEAHVDEAASELLARRHRPSGAESSLESSGKHQIRNGGRTPRRDEARTQSERASRTGRERS